MDIGKFCFGEFVNHLKHTKKTYKWSRLGYTSLILPTPPGSPGDTHRYPEPWGKRARLWTGFVSSGVPSRTEAGITPGSVLRSPEGRGAAPRLTSLPPARSEGHVTTFPSGAAGGALLRAGLHHPWGCREVCGAGGPAGITEAFPAIARSCVRRGAGAPRNRRVCAGQVPGLLLAAERSSYRGRPPHPNAAVHGRTERRVASVDGAEFVEVDGGTLGGGKKQEPARPRRHKNSS